DHQGPPVSGRFRMEHQKMAFTPFVMPKPVMNENGGFEYPDANIPYVDNATEKGNQFGWGDPRTQGNLTRDVLRYQNGQLMHGMGLGFDGLGNQMATGFNDLTEQMQYGGIYGNSQNRVYSPQSKNGYGAGWGGSNPF